MRGSVHESEDCIIDLIAEASSLRLAVRHTWKAKMKEDVASDVAEHPSNWAHFTLGVEDGQGDQLQ